MIHFNFDNLFAIYLMEDSGWECMTDMSREAADV